MVEILDEVRLRDKNQLTLPSIIVDILNFSAGDIVRFERVEGNICICKAVSHKVNSRCGGDNVAGAD